MPTFEEMLEEQRKLESLPEERSITIEKPKTQPKKEPFDLDQAVTQKAIIKKVSKQLWKKSPEFINDIEELEEYLTQKLGITFDFVKKERIRRAKLEQET